MSCGSGAKFLTSCRPREQPGAGAAVLGRLLCTRDHRGARLSFSGGGAGPHHHMRPLRQGSSSGLHPTSTPGRGAESVRGQPIHSGLRFRLGMIFR